MTRALQHCMTLSTYYGSDPAVMLSKPMRWLWRRSNGVFGAIVEHDACRRSPAAAGGEGDPHVSVSDVAQHGMLGQRLPQPVTASREVATLVSLVDDRHCAGLCACWCVRDACSCFMCIDGPVIMKPGLMLMMVCMVLLGAALHGMQLRPPVHGQVSRE